MRIIRKGTTRDKNSLCINERFQESSNVKGVYFHNEVFFWCHIRIWTLEIMKSINRKSQKQTSKVPTLHGLLLSAMQHQQLLKQTIYTPSQFKLVFVRTQQVPKIWCRISTFNLRRIFLSYLIHECVEIFGYPLSRNPNTCLTLNLLTWRIGWAHNNARK